MTAISPEERERILRQAVSVAIMMWLDRVEEERQHQHALRMIRAGLLVPEGVQP